MYTTTTRIAIAMFTAIFVGVVSGLWGSSCGNRGTKPIRKSEFQPGGRGFTKAAVGDGVWTSAFLLVSSL